MSLLNKKKEKMDKIIINCEAQLKEDFRNLCKENNLKMTEVLRYAIKEIVEKGEFDSVDFRAE